MMKLLILLMILISCSPTGNRGGRSTGTAFSAAVNGLTMNHFVDPETGNVSEKLSIPKNYSGNLYLAVDNIDRLSDKILFARLRFGKDRNHVKEIPTIIGYAPSIVPGQTQPVLILSLSARPFLSVPLEYDLFDYNTYNFTSNTVSIEQNNRDKDLYCRGLNLEDDPTATNGQCDGANDRCLYGYAKIIDRGLYNITNQQGLFPTGAQIEMDDLDGYFSKCLSDQATQVYSNQSFGLGMLLTVAGIDYTYRGPYQPVNSQVWAIKSNAIWNSQYGIFQQYLGNSRNIELGYESMMFPRFSKISINSGVEHVGSDDPGEMTELKTDLDNDGKSYWMSGCNLRVVTKNEINEHYGSCNVTADIEIFYRENGNEAIVASSRWDSQSRKVKLQILQEGDLSTSNGILNPSFRTCSSDTACADNECCFNGRCWSDQLVSQCGGTANNARPNGELCSDNLGNALDTLCLSQCCRGPNSGNETAGIRCRANDPSLGVYCNKPVGATCIYPQSCSRQLVTKERLIRNSNTPGDCEVRLCKSCEYQTCDLTSFTCQAREDDGTTIEFDPNNPNCAAAAPESSEWTCQGDPDYNSFTCP